MATARSVVAGRNERATRRVLGETARAATPVAARQPE